ncbi:MAG: Alkaline phosphatase synthesis sensor protein PhoR [Actinobacteria bacterium ADurb.BinA094]|nr:MAG: Alkaline phosphatase synthesis sensor protein PhoR [Actinobacteria bacterium ADurb.BinA094]
MTPIVVWLLVAALLGVAVFAFVRGVRFVLAAVLAAILIWAVTFTSALGIILGVVLVGGAILAWSLLGGLPGTAAARASRAAHRSSGTPLRTTLFRTVIVALLALSLAVGAVLTWNERNQQKESLSSSQQGLALLDLAYTSQPVRGPGSGPASDDVPFGSGSGLWIDQAGYRQIRDVVAKSNSGPQTFLLDGRGQQPARLVLPPSAYAEWRDPKSGSDIAIPDQSFPDQVLGFPITEDDGRVQEARGDWLSYLKEHGWRVGWSDTWDGRVQYAMWRTGANTAAYVQYRPRTEQSTPWYLRPIGWGFQALILRRIVKPVRQVAEASVVLADGGTPMEIPTRAPQELSVMAQSFNRMAKKLKRAQDTEKDFLMSVGHELKTPLTAIDGYAELLQDGAVDSREAAEVLGAESARLRRLITDLLDLARIDRSEFTVVDEPVDLAVTAREVVARFAGLAGALGVELRADAAEPAPARGDAGRLLQVASNLVENALRATGDGGRVDVVARPGALSVRDTGPGLSDEDMGRAFDRFYLHRKYADGPSVGTGLGLAIVKELTEAMGGGVVVESGQGAGSTFTITLPAPAPAAAIADV